MDELTQSIKINENLKEDLSPILEIKCANCIQRDFTTGGGLFGDDSDDDKFGVKEPLSDSLPENKHSKSEKSLKKPLQLFQEEQKTGTMSGGEMHKNSDATRTQTYLTNFSASRPNLMK